MTVRTRYDEQRECAAGVPDAAAFESFFREHYRIVVRLAQSVVGDIQGAQDVAQEVFLAAYRRFPGDYDQAAGWVRVAAIHSALNVLRGERRRDKRQRLVHEAGSLPSAEDMVVDRENTRGAPSGVGASPAPVGRGAGDASWRHELRRDR